MFSLLHLKHRGDIYTITYSLATGDIHEIQYIPCSGHRGELLDFYKLPFDLQNKIQNELCHISNAAHLRDTEGEE